MVIDSLLKGLLPKALHGKWKRIFSPKSKSITIRVIRQFTRFVEEEARQRIWKERCKITIEWENSKVSPRNRKLQMKRDEEAWHGNASTDAHCWRASAGAASLGSITSPKHAPASRQIH